MIITTSDNVPGREIAETIGFVTQNSVRARNIGRDVLAGLKNIAGGEIGAYRQLLEESRQELLQHSTAQAESMGADAIVALRLSTASVMSGSAEILAYGTAVKLR